jgi:hypothetical protein
LDSYSYREFSYIQYTELQMNLKYNKIQLIKCNS